MTQTKAVFCALAAFFGWVLVDTSIKLTGQDTLSPWAMMAVLNLAGAAGLLGWCITKKKISALRLAYPRSQGVIVFLMVLINYSNVVALKYLPLSHFFLIGFTLPLMMAVASTWFGHEKVSFIKIVCIIAGFVGVSIVLVPHIGDGSGKWIGYVAVFISVLGFIAYSLIINKISQNVSAETMLFWNMLPVGTLGLLCSLHTVFDIQQNAALFLIGGGLLNVLASGLYNKALQHTTPSNVAQTHYSQILFGSAMGYAVWHEIPTWNLLAGAVFIVGAGLVVIAEARKDNQA